MKANSISPSVFGREVSYSQCAAIPNHFDSNTCWL